MKVWKIIEQLQSVVNHTNCYEKMQSCEPEWREMYKWSEKEKSQLHELAWQLVALTRPDDDEFKARMDRYLRIIS